MDQNGQTITQQVVILKSVLYYTLYFENCLHRIILVYEVLQILDEHLWTFLPFYETIVCIYFTSFKYCFIKTDLQHITS